MTARRCGLACLLLALGACSDTGPADGGPADLPRRDAASVDQASPDRVSPDIELDPLTHLTQLGSAQDFERLKGVKDEVKYLLSVDGRQTPAPFTGVTCIFQNTKRFAYHLLFLLHFPELSTTTLDKYLELVLEGQTRVWWGGGLMTWPKAKHPRRGALGVMSYVVWHSEGEAEHLSVAQLVELDRRLKGCVPYAAEQLVLVPSDAEQVGYIKPLVDQLEAQGVDVMDESQLQP